MGREPVADGDKKVKKEHKKKSKKEKKKKESEPIQNDEEIAKEMENVQGEAVREKNKKRKKQPKETSDETEVVQKDQKAAERKRKREEKKQKKKEILAKIPKRDEDGISYTKQQIRRMVRRVERGLPPVPTPEEEAELKRQEAQLRKEEEAELAGMLYKKEDDRADENDDDDDKGEDNDGEEDEVEDEDEVEGGAEEEPEDEPIEEEKNNDKVTEAKPAKKRKLSKKPVPKDYVCQACQNKHNFPHWIYDCPDKVTVRGTNKVAAGRHGNNVPSAKKVFVSGLFFDTKPTEVKAMFQSCGKVTSCKLLKFPDTGRCKGQAFVVFDSEEAASKALKLSGTKMSSADTDKKGKKTAEKRELELKVSRVMSRTVTKGKH